MRPGTLSAVVKTARPRQWVKNLFVAAPVVFARHLGDGRAALRALAAFGIFCALSSAVYFWNDVIDVEKDRAHPTKRFRPIPAGLLSLRAAQVISATLAAGGLACASILSLPFAGCALAYLAQNIAYSWKLKHIVYVDVMVIATGFLLRTGGGALAIPVEASPYLLVCTGLLALFLGFGKRLSELQQAGARGVQQRASLAGYRASTLEAAMWLTGGATLLAYVLYTRAPHTLVFFGTEHMWWTAPFVAFGLVRFVHILRRQSGGESPTDAMLRDPIFILNLIGFAAVAVLVIYRP
jgi:decaprenyl-phosphate phosphoribosyltransferase